MSEEVLRRDLLVSRLGFDRKVDGTKVVPEGKYRNIGIFTGSTVQGCRTLLNPSDPTHFHQVCVTVFPHDVPFIE